MAKRKKKPPEDQSVFDLICDRIPEIKIGTVTGRAYMGTGDNPVQTRLEVTLPNGRKEILSIDQERVPPDKVHPEIIVHARAQRGIVEDIEFRNKFDRKGKHRGYDALSNLMERTFTELSAKHGNIPTSRELLDQIQNFDDESIVGHIFIDKSIEWTAHGKTRTTTYPKFKDRLTSIRKNFKK